MHPADGMSPPAPRPGDAAVGPAGAAIGSAGASVGPAGAAVSEAVALRAAQWFFLLRSGEASAHDRACWQAWRAADPAHELAWQRAERLSRMLGELPAAVSAQVLGRPARADRRRAAKALALLLATGPAGWLAWRSGPAREWLAEYRTGAGETRDLRLADGSRVLLNTASAIDVAYDAARRLVRLHAGEILVETAPDAAPAGDPAYRPFVVQAGQARLRALGTRFTVRRRDRAHGRVAVLDGAVRVDVAGQGDTVGQGEAAVPVDAAGRGGGAVVVRAGWQADFSDAGVQAAAVDAAGAQADDWTRGVLRVREMRLDDFLAELGRYRPGLLRCDPAVAGLRISGAFQLRDTDAVLDSLPRALPVAVAYRSRYWVTVTAAG